MGPDVPRRAWFLDNAYLPSPERYWLGGLGRDEFGNRTVFVRVSPSRYVVLALDVPLRRELWDVRE